MARIILGLLVFIRIYLSQKVGALLINSLIVTTVVQTDFMSAVWRKRESSLLLPYLLFL